MGPALAGLPAQRDEGEESALAQDESAPDQRGDIDREEDVGEQRAADPHVCRDRAAQIARQQDRAKQRGAGNSTTGSMVVNLMAVSKARNSTGMALTIGPAKGLSFETETA